MSKYYSLDLRRRAAGFCLKHGSGKTAETFSIGRATAVRWADKLRRTGDVAIDLAPNFYPALSSL